MFPFPHPVIICICNSWFTTLTVLDSIVANL